MATVENKPVPVVPDAPAAQPLPTYSRQIAPTDTPQPAPTPAAPAVNRPTSTITTDAPGTTTPNYRDDPHAFGRYLAQQQHAKTAPTGEPGTTQNTTVTPLSSGDKTATPTSPNGSTRPAPRTTTTPPDPTHTPQPAADPRTPNTTPPDTSRTLILTPEQQAQQDYDATKNGPPVAPQRPIPPAADVGVAPGTTSAITAQRKAEQDPKYQAAKRKYNTDKAKYDAAKALYDKAAARIRANSTLTEAQKTTLDNGGTVKITPARAAYLKHFLALTGGNTRFGDAVDNMDEYATKNPALRGHVSSSIYIVSSNQVSHGGRRGSFRDLPAGLQAFLKQEPQIGTVGRNGHTAVRGILDYARYDKLVRLLAASDPRYKNSSAVSEHLIIAAGHLAHSANNNGPSEIPAAESVINDLLALGGRDHNATIAVLARDKSYSTIAALLNHDWRGRDSSGTVADLVRAERDPAKRAQWLDLLAKNPELRDQKIPNESAGIIILLRQLSARPSHVLAQQAASNVAHYLSRKKLSDNNDPNRESQSPVYRNRGVAQTIATVMSPYYAALGGARAGYLGVDSFKTQDHYAAFLNVLFRDPVAAAKATLAIKQTQAGLATRFWGEGGRHPDYQYAVTYGHLQSILLTAATTANWSNDQQTAYLKSVQIGNKSAAYDAGAGVFATLLGAIPVIGLPASVATATAVPFLKTPIVEGTDTPDDDLDLPLGQRIIDMVNESDNEAYALAALVRGLAARIPAIKDDPDYTAATTVDSVREDRSKTKAKNLLQKYRLPTDFFTYVTNGKGAQAIEDH